MAGNDLPAANEGGGGEQGMAGVARLRHQGRLRQEGILPVQSIFLPVSPPVDQQWIHMKE